MLYKFICGQKPFQYSARIAKLSDRGTSFLYPVVGQSKKKWLLTDDKINILMRIPILKVDECLRIVIPGMIEDEVVDFGIFLAQDMTIAVPMIHVTPMQPPA